MRPVPARHLAFVAVLACGPASPPPDAASAAAPGPATPAPPPEVQVDTSPPPPARRSPPSPATPPPEPLVEVDTTPASLRLDMRYLGADNFTGAPVPGYEAARLWVHRDLAAALERARREARAQGYGLLIFDAYRPERASAHFVRYAREHGRSDWIRDGYIARRSTHNHGLAIDSSLFELASGEALDMGGPFDEFGPGAHRGQARGAALEHRQRLAQIMVAAGFTPYAKEWWHFSRPKARDSAALDVAITP